MTRFDGLFQQAKRGERGSEPDVEPVKHSDVQKSKRSDAQMLEQSNDQTTKLGKSKDPEYKRTTVYLRKQTHLKLRAAAMEDEREMSEILNELAEAWLASRRSDA